MANPPAIHELPVQFPSQNEFSASDLIWSKVEGHKDTEDDVALIPFSRVEDFLKGESDNVECPTRFRIEGGRKKARLSGTKTPKPDEYSEFRLYWCAFGPDCYGDSETTLPSRKFRVGGRKRALRPQAMRGCLCHFIIKRLFSKPDVAVIIYNERRHVDRSGEICHGPLDRNALGPRTMTHPYISNELREQALSMIYLGISEKSLVQKYVEDAEVFGGSAGGSDLAFRYVQKLEKVIKRSTYELDPDDSTSVHIWVERHAKNVFFYQESSDYFILGIQTEWQLQQMVRLGNNKLMAANVNFGINELKYPLYTLLVFDGNQHPIPVAWVITRSFTIDDVRKWAGALNERVCAKDRSWKPSGLVVDDAATEIQTIREVFGCPILLCIWRVRRAWLKNIQKKGTSEDVGREMFKRLGHLMYSLWDGVEPADVVSEFLQDFVDQSDFLKDFKEEWAPKIEMWLAATRIFPIASQETCGAFEAYNYRLETRLSDEFGTPACVRVDWLVHKLTTELHSSYWLDRYAEEKGILGNIREQYINSTSWHRAQQIPDSDVSFSDKNCRLAKVISQGDHTQVRSVWNPGSEFALCDCSWSKEGYLCKHVIKVNSMVSNLKLAQPSMAYNSYHQLLLSLWQNSPDDSIFLDRMSSKAFHMEKDLQKIIEDYYSGGIQQALPDIGNVGNLSNAAQIMWGSKKQRKRKHKSNTDSSLAMLEWNKEKNVQETNLDTCQNNGRISRHKKFRTLKSLGSASNGVSVSHENISSMTQDPGSTLREDGNVANNAGLLQVQDDALIGSSRAVISDPNSSNKNGIMTKTKECDQVHSHKKRWKLKLKDREINISG